MVDPETAKRPINLQNDVCCCRSGSTAEPAPQIVQRHRQPVGANWLDQIVDNVKIGCPPARLHSSGLAAAWAAVYGGPRLHPSAVRRQSGLLVAGRARLDRRAPGLGLERPPFTPLVAIPDISPSGYAYPRFIELPHLHGFSRPNGRGRRVQPDLSPGRACNRASVAWAPAGL